MTTQLAWPLKKYGSSYRARNWLGTMFLVSIGLFFTFLSVLIPFYRPLSLQDWGVDLALAFVGVGSVVLAALGPYAESQKYLITSPRGIEYGGFGFRVFAQWDEIDRVGLIHPGEYYLGPNRAELARYIQNGKIGTLFPENNIECLVLRHPLPFEKNLWAKSIIRDQTWYIPLSDFLWWRFEELGRDIRKYAPHIKDG